MCTAVAVIAEILVRNLATVMQAALDRFSCRTVSVLAREVVGVAGAQQRLGDFALGQPAPRHHGAEPECALIEPGVALAFARGGELVLDLAQGSERIGAATLVRSLAGRLLPRRLMLRLA